MVEADPPAIRDLIISDVAVVDAPLAALISEVRRLHDRIHGWSPTSWREPCVPYRFGANSPEPVSYPHLTLPTNRQVLIPVFAVS